LKIFLLFLSLSLSYHVFGSYDSDVIAETLWREARGGGKECVDNVASVIYNRWISSNRTILEIVLYPKQFSCWNNKVITKRTIKQYLIKDLTNEKDKLMWEYCKSVATSIDSKTFKSVSIHNHYYNPNLVIPKWSHKLLNKELIGNLIFGYVNMRF